MVRVETLTCSPVGNCLVDISILEMLKITLALQATLRTSSTVSKFLRRSRTVPCALVRSVTDISTSSPVLRSMKMSVSQVHPRNQETRTSYRRSLSPTRAGRGAIIGELKMLDWLGLIICIIGGQRWFGIHSPFI